MPTRNGERGRVLILVIIIIFTLSAFWFVALSSTGNELRLTGGRKSAAQQLFDAEAGVNAVIEDFNAVAPSLGGDPTTAVATLQVKDPTTNPDPALQRVVAQITCRPIQDELAIAGQPADEHRPAISADLGIPLQRLERYSVDARVFRYSINSVAGDKEIQVGVVRVVP